MSDVNAAKPTIRYTEHSSSVRARYSDGVCRKMYGIWRITWYPMAHKHTIPITIAPTMICVIESDTFLMMKQKKKKKKNGNNEHFFEREKKILNVIFQLATKAAPSFLWVKITIFPLSKPAKVARKRLFASFSFVVHAKNYHTYNLHHRVVTSNHFDCGHLLFQCAPKRSVCWIAC